MTKFSVSLADSPGQGINLRECVSVLSIVFVEQCETFVRLDFVHFLLLLYFKTGLSFNRKNRFFRCIF